MGQGAVRAAKVRPEEGQLFTGRLLPGPVLREWTQAGRVKLSVSRIDREELRVPQVQVKTPGREEDGGGGDVPPLGLVVFVQNLRQQEPILRLLGSIAEQGTHNDLLARGGDYAQLYNTQNLHR